MNSGSSFSFLTYLWPTGIQGTWQKVNCMVKSRATDSVASTPAPAFLSGLESRLQTVTLNTPPPNPAHTPGLRIMSKRLLYCDYVIEVHDARVSFPFSLFSDV